MREPKSVGTVTGRRQRRVLLIEQRGDRRVVGVVGERAIICQYRKLNGEGWVWAWPGRVKLDELHGDPAILIERYLAGEV